MAKLSKRTLFFRAYLDDANPNTFLNATESARHAGYAQTSDANLRSMGYRILRDRKDELNRWMEEEGLSDKALKRKLFQLLHAKETKFFQHEGEVTDQREVEALHIQVKALDMAHKVRGSYAPEKHEHTGKDGEAIEIKATELMNMAGLEDAIKRSKKTE